MISCGGDRDASGIEMMRNGCKLFDLTTSEYCKCFFAFGTGVGDLTGGGIKFASSNFDAKYFCVLGMAEMDERRTVICLGKIGSAFFDSCETIVVVGVADRDEANVIETLLESFGKCVRICSVYIDLNANDFKQTAHCICFNSFRNCFDFNAFGLMAAAGCLL